MIDSNSIDFQLSRCADFLASLSSEELEGELLSGVMSQRMAGKTDQDCAKFLFEKCNISLRDFMQFNESLGVFFGE